MNFFSISKRIEDWINNASDNIFSLQGVESNQWSLLLKSFLENKNSLFDQRNHVLVCPSEEIAEGLYASLKDHCGEFELLFFPGLDYSPYSNIISSEKSMLQRFFCYQKISESQKIILLCTHESLLLLGPKEKFFTDHNLKIEISEIISPYELSSKLVDLGYSSTPTVEEPGTFCQKGEIFDIYPLNSRPIRLHYFDDMIEEIFGIDTVTQKTLHDKTYEKVVIGPSPYIFTRDKFHNTLRESLPHFSPNFKLKFEARKTIFEKLSLNQSFENFPVYIPLFLKESSSILEFFDSNKTLIHFINPYEIEQETSSLIEKLRVDYEDESNDQESDIILPEPKNLYRTNFQELINQYKNLGIAGVNISQSLDENNSFEVKLEKNKNYFNKYINQSLSKHDFIQEVIEFLKNEFKHSGEIIYTYSNENSLNEFKHLLEVSQFTSDIVKRIHYTEFNLESGFFYQNEKVLVLAEGDLFSYKKVKTKKNYQKNIDLFAEQLSSLKEGDLVIHAQFGVGKYLGLENLDLGGNNDFLVIEYQSKDKVYVPVYNLNLVQKHADAGAAKVLDSLRSNKFSKVKAKARSSAKELAFDLLKLQAQRESAEAFSFSPPDQHFKEFELAFPFSETPDQHAAIENVIEDMQKPKPMDHLVCGDVGFGKTEVAMRAAFKAVLDGKQVAILVPTTILALQHYNSFKTRFKNFAVAIDFVSRFKNAKQTKEVFEKVESGDLDIVIGTHKILSKNLKFKDLGLVIVDEEQRFGVSHKEKLKLLKSSVDFLTLTATPIPRTLQLSLLGLRDLSIIQTPPPKRQSIKTYLIKDDQAVIQSAIKRELERGGQVFIVHNRVQDIELFSANIRELVPEAKIVFAHGQMSEKELEKRMNAFYQGEYQVLISTTIIESGLDIPNANTMIVDRSDRYGLSQLHQLRGRIGRSDKKAYCYFVIPNKKLTPEAEKRLKALQTYADIGSGFHIANSDLEIRGAGDILGASQSGHIESVGLELYMDLLSQAIREIKGESEIIKRDIEISTPFQCLIPESYISDSSLRLKYYKRLSNCTEQSTLDDLENEITDIYGHPPQEFTNLTKLLKIKVQLQKLAVKSLKTTGNSIVVTLDQKILDSHPSIRNIMVDYFLSKPKLYQFTPDYKVYYTPKRTVDLDSIFEFAIELKSNTIIEN